MPHITGFFHGGITVKDMEQSLKFYRDGLQLEVEFDVLNDKDYLREVVGVSFSAIRIVYLRIPNSGFIELLEYQGADRKSASAPGFHRARPDRSAHRSPRRSPSPGDRKTHV